MHRLLTRSFNLATLMLLVATGSASALNINVNYGNLDAAQKAVVDRCVADWLAKDNEKQGKVHLDFNYAPINAALPAGAEARYPYGQGWNGNNPPTMPPLAVTTNFTQDAVTKKPTSATITINSNYTWWNGINVPAVWPAGAYDLRSVVKHEIGHAIGFAIVYTKFAVEVVAGPGANRTFTPTGTILTPANAGTHTDHGTHLDDIMNPELLAQTRVLKNVNPEAETVIAYIWRLVKAPGVSSIGLIVLSLAILGTGAFVLRRRASIA